MTYSIHFKESFKTFLHLNVVLHRQMRKIENRTQQAKDIENVIYQKYI